jgi:hypothetical protein
MVPCERFHSRSLDLPVFAASLRPEGGMVVRVTPWTPPRPGQCCRNEVDANDSQKNVTWAFLLPLFVAYAVKFGVLTLDVHTHTDSSPSIRLI